MLPLLLLALAPVDISQAVHDAIDPCVAARRKDGIVVCGRSKEEIDHRFRLTPPPDGGFDPLGSVESISRERHRLIDGDGAAPDLTRGSCSTVGASGWTGCMIKSWREQDQRKGQ